GLEAEAMQDLLGAGLQGVAIQLVEPALYGAEALHERLELICTRRIGHRCLELRELGAHRGDLASSRDGRLQHGLAAHLAHVLVEIPDADPLLDHDLPGVGRFLSNEQAKDRRLASAVRAYQTHPISAEQGEARVDEEDLATVLFCDTI